MDNGAHYHRSDFQVHTPRDRQWKGPRPIGEEAREQYGHTFVSACRNAGLRAVAITDHHDFAFVDYIRAAAAQETDAEGESLRDRERLVVFPGLELSLTVPCQALLLLDADFPAERLETLLELLHIDVEDPGAAKHAEPQPSHSSGWVNCTIISTRRAG
jgi:type III restriction enzyme